MTSLFSKVALTFSCKGLKDRDVTSKSDPIIQVLMEDSRRQTWKEVRKAYLIFLWATSSGMTMWKMNFIVEWFISESDTA